MVIPNLSNTDVLRFEAKIYPEPNTGCWLWGAGSRGKTGYGAFKIGVSVVDSHRVSYHIYKGNIPEGLLVCHTCDVRFCVNPEHLFLGTHKDNFEDARKKDRISLQNHSPKKSETEWKHGITSTYDKRGCRCDQCKEVKKLRQRRYRLSVKISG